MSTEPNLISTTNAPRSPLDSPSPSQLWAPPRSPLPPHRLAKLANALGVSMPMPATQPTTPYPSSPYLSHSNSLPTPSSATEFLRRSPTPSAASASGTYQTHTSKYLLHVIPPLHLHDFDLPEEAAPPPNASGYHTQFRRGTLVPVYSTLQLQLSAIAKEYALPSTMGMILYLVNANVTRSPNVSVGLDGVGDEMGPRLSEDIWRHLWIRVLKTEQREDMAPRAPSPNPLGLVLSAKTSPNPNGFDSIPPFLRTAAGHGSTDQATTPYPLTPSASSTTTTSTMQHQSKSSLSSVAQSEPETPDSSVADSRRADSLDLPGLNSNSIIPILAKVEFDIDRRKAAWYDPWVRSRKMNQVKRAESRASRKDTVDDSSDERKAPLDLKLSERLITASPISLQSLAAKDKESSEEAGYQQISDSTSEDSDYGNAGEQDEDEEDEEEDATARVASIPNGRDPLSDVFGTDEQTWAELRNSQLAKRPNSNPNVVDLVLSAADLANLPELPPSDDEDDLVNLTKSEDEVEDLLSLMGRPSLSVSIPASPPQGKKHVPPPLVLKPPGSDLAIPADSPLPSTGSARLAYLNSTSEESIALAPAAPADDQLAPPEYEDDEFMDEVTRVKSPAESEKREGAIFDDLDLGLDLTEEYDENDPDDHRRSQLMMKAQLDEIERNLAQFSPKALRTDLSDGMPTPLSPNLSGVLRNSDVLPPTPGISRLSETFSNGSATPPADPNVTKKWPSVPFSSLKDAPDVPQTATFPPSPSPPRLALNGVTASTPKPFVAPNPNSEVSEETQARRRELEEGQELTYPAFHASMPSSSDSPIIPLSPDPFGRYPSSSSPDPSSSRLPSPWGIDNNPASLYDSDYNGITSPTEGARPPSSRFSADSTSNEEAISKSLKNTNSNSLMSVKSLRKLWRKSNKSSISSNPGTISGRTSPATSLGRPSEDLSSLPALPTTPTFGAFPPSQMQQHPNAAGFAAPTGRGSLAPPMPPQMPPQMPDRRDRDTITQLQFDQESPYPIHRAPPARYSPRPPSPAYPNQPPPPQSTLPVEKPSVRKSILKAFKSASSSSNNNANTPSDARSSIDRSGRPRRGSVSSTGAHTPSMLASEIPPSPRIPEHLLTGPRSGTGTPQPPDSRQSIATRPRSNTSMARSSSPPRSMASSRDSEETRPSFDTSQFEMVSPKMSSTLSYPYHGLDHN